MLPASDKSSYHNDHDYLSVILFCHRGATCTQQPVAAPELFVGGGGHRGAKCDSEGAKIQKFAENG